MIAFRVLAGTALAFVVPLSGHSAAAAPEQLVITADTTLAPSKTYGPLVIKSSHITIDGRGAWLIGADQGRPNQFQGVGITARGVSHVTLRNVNAKGWETALHVADGAGWQVEGCNFSDNFHDPAYGWGENGRRGGIVWERVRDSTLRKNRANRVWDACVLVHSDGNTLEDNDFSHTSNTCLKLWHASRNTVVGNTLSHGIRIDPGEVHARDSTCVLIESGSNDNRFLKNDCTHGGDGIFIRVLNGWVSTGNHFEENDCSYANNNCVEAWSPRNTYVRNKANHGSYGFWLGASDQTRLIGNEASHNGLATGHHNSPHLPQNGHAGIVFMFGPSSHTVVQGNTCSGNNGAGIALIGDLESQGRKWKAFHWIIQQNSVTNNRWGVYMQHADWIDMAANEFRDNQVADLLDAGGVTNLRRVSKGRATSEPPQARLIGPALARVGQTVAFEAAPAQAGGSAFRGVRWDLGDGTVATTPRVSHVFRQPGFYRLGLTVDDGVLADLAWRDLYVVADVQETGTEGDSAEWSWVDPQSRVRFDDDRTVRIAGDSSLHAHVEPYGGGRMNLLFPKSRSAAWNLNARRELVFWFKGINENLPAWQDVNPIVTLHETEERFLRLTPKSDFLSQPPYNEAREGWTYFVVPLAGDERWERSGDDIAVARWLTIGFDSWGAPPLDIWLDGLAFP